jgi:L-malate glycosyltransferase
VVASRAGGLPELIEDGISGILEPPGSVEAMGRRAVDLLRDSAAHAAMRQSALARAQSFSADRIVPLYEDLYAGAIR